MNSKWNIIGSIIQLIVGLAAIVCFVILAVNGENITKWRKTLIAAVAFVVLGIVGIIEYKNRRNFYE